MTPTQIAAAVALEDYANALLDLHNAIHGEKQLFESWLSFSYRLGVSHPTSEAARTAWERQTERREQAAVRMGAQLRAITDTQQALQQEDPTS